MSNQKKHEIFNLLNAMTVAFNSPQDKQRLEIYTENLAKFDLSDIKKAISWLMENSKFFPTLSEIRERIKPKTNTEENAIEMSTAILEAVQQFGQYRVDEAKEKLGMVAWNAVQRCGGWSGLCTITNAQLPTVRAQLKNICKTVLGIFDRDPNLCKLEFQKQAQNEIKQIAEEK